MPQSLTVETSAPPNSPEMREAARFLRYLRHGYQRDYRSANLHEWWNAYSDAESSWFTDVVERVTNRTVYWCDSCEMPHWTDSWHGFARGVDRDLCTGCLEDFYWCDECDEWSAYPHAHEDEDEERSACEAPHFSFRFPVLGQENGSVANDTRFVIESAGGVIAREGIDAVGKYLMDSTGQDIGYRAYLHLRSDAFEQKWTTKGGNFPKRVAKWYLQQGYKLTPEQVSEIGNVARRFASAQAKHAVEFTRDLNQSASDFFHSGSCWWGSESHSRCILKQCGGLAIRTWTVDGTEAPNPNKGPQPTRVNDCGCPSCTNYAHQMRAWKAIPDTITQPVGKLSGRAWIVPLDNALQLTHDAENARAFVVFNDYGIDGYEFARLVAQMTGKSYRRIGFQLGNAWVNSDRGFLIADPATCQRTDSLSFDFRHECWCES